MFAHPVATRTSRQIQGAQNRAAGQAWELQVIDLAIYGGWKVHHELDNAPRTNRKGQSYVKAKLNPGFPDLVAFRGGERIAAELKTATARVTPQQREWLRVLDAAGFETYVWRPQHWDDIYKRLLGGRYGP